jgi:hypothetical protein
MSRLTSFALLALLAISCVALVPPAFDRRHFVSGVVGSAAAFIAAGQASATTARTGASSPWTGDYDDPNHPGCLRQVKVVGAPLKGDGSRSPYPVVEVKGYDNGAKACTERPNRSDIWSVQGILKNNEVKLDFSSKGGPKDLLAKYSDGAIVFPDGNQWTKVPGGTPDRLPKDMTTLKSN